MTIPIQIHVSSIERLYSDNLITDEEYKRIMNRLISASLKAKEAKDNNG